MKPFIVLAVLLLGAGVLAGPAFTSSPMPIELRTVKYRDLCAAVRAQRGKVVVLDVWGEFCAPCKKEFPHLVELHERYGKDGLVCISVSVDEPDNKAAAVRALQFLQENRAAFPNFLLDEDVQVWQDKLDMNGPPAVFVFDRNNRRAGKFDYSDPNKQYSYADVEKLVRALLELK